MVKYTLYLGTATKEADLTEEIELALLNNEVGFEELEGYTLYVGMGCYKKVKEKCYMLTHFGENSSEEILRKIANTYKEKFKQESVLLTKEEVTEIQNI